MDCNTCERRNKRKKNECQVFSEKPKKCWAWTDDKDWAKKVRVAVEKYKQR